MSDPLGVGSKGQTLTFSEHGHVAYQMKGNDECSSMVANICPQTPSTALTLALGPKFNSFRTWSCCILN